MASPGTFKTDNMIMAIRTQEFFFINPRDSVKPRQKKIHASKYVWIYSVVLLRNILGNLFVKKKKKN